MLLESLAVMKSFAARILRQCLTWLLCNMRRNWLRRLWWGRERNLLPLSLCIITSFFPRERERSQEGMLSWMSLRLWGRRRMKDSLPPRTPLLRGVQNRSPDGLERCNKELLNYKDRTKVLKLTWCNLIADVLKHVANWGKFGLLKIWKPLNVKAIILKVHFQ